MDITKAWNAVSILIVFALSSCLAYGSDLGVGNIATKDGFYLDYLGKILFIFLFIAALVYVTYKSKNKLSRFGIVNADVIKIISRVNIGQNGSLLLVKVGNEHLLLGASMSQINLVKDISQCGIDFDKFDNKEFQFSGILRHLKNSYKETKHEDQ